jgi:hypothetical protein
MNYGLELVGGNKKRLQPLQMILNKGLRLIFNGNQSAPIIPMCLESNALLVDVRATIAAIRLLNKSTVLKTPLRKLAAATLQGRPIQNVTKRTWIRASYLLRRKYLTAHPTTYNNSQLQAQIVAQRTAEHTTYMTANAAMIYLAADYYSTRYISTWFLADPQWKAGLTFLIHARLGQLWSKAKAKHLSTLTLTTYHLTHCLLCNAAHAPVEEDEIAHLVVSCPLLHQTRTNSGLSELIELVSTLFNQNDWSETQISRLLFGGKVGACSLWGARGPLVRGVPFEMRILAFLQDSLRLYYDQLRLYTAASPSVVA